MSLDNLTPTTGAWLIVSILALFFAILNLQSSRHDVAASRLINNFRRTTRLVIATGAVHRNWIKVAVFSWWVFLGIFFGFFDPPRILGFAGLLGLIGTALGLAYIGYHEDRERRVLAEMLAEDQATDVLEKHDEAIAEGEATQARHDAERTQDVHDADIAQATVRAADRMQRSLERTAANTERIANNTEKDTES